MTTADIVTLFTESLSTPTFAESDNAKFLKFFKTHLLSKGGRAFDDEFKTPVFLIAKNLKPFIPSSLIENSDINLSRVLIYALANTSRNAQHDHDWTPDSPTCHLYWNMLSSNTENRLLINSV